MSYDTTVHDAIEPPLPRISSHQENSSSRVISRTVLRRWMRPAAVVMLTVSVLLVVNWVVATLTPVQPTTHESNDLLPLEIPRPTSAITGQ